MGQTKKPIRFEPASVGRYEEGVTLLDFGASWCEPCREQQPVTEKITSRFDAFVRIIELDVDQHPDTATYFGVTSVPTFIVIKNGIEVKRFIGRQSENAISHCLEQALERLKISG